jgi:hypothetical protein
MGCLVDEYGIDGNYGTGMKKGLRDGPWFRFSGGADDVVHPGETLWVAALKVEVVRDDAVRTVTLGGRPVPEADIACAVRYGCMDIAMRTEDMRIAATSVPFVMPSYPAEPG